MDACVSNPYRGAIDPDEIEGKKIIGKMIEGLSEEDKFDLKNENIVEFKDSLEEDSSDFCYGSVECAIWSMINMVTLTTQLTLSLNSIHAL